MTALEYLKAKNELVEKVTGLILIPEDQLVEHKPDMRYFHPRLGLSYMNCTYCTLYYDKACKGCPMKEAGNGCTDHLKTSYGRATDAWDEKATDTGRAELLRLGEQFQKEYEEK